ncbi:hypothetical protein NW133_07280 [Staphylococcus pettenkoferi]|uniref:Uncharacterized protein n=1 Tax=Staphylococcus pettenkoferi TaxID=170573 RepID=A0ABT4BMI0_9STAP|nr:hypothetical protein [Staphylococcus pettenkoferi]MCY1583329.1 hypothetical protein [Staphylococcus pettenkoferi]
MIDYDKLQHIKDLNTPFYSLYRVPDTSIQLIIDTDAHEVEQAHADKDKMMKVRQDFSLIAYLRQRGILHD